MFTDKITFKGTPAQFWAVVQEYALDTRSTERSLSIELIAPTKEVIVPRLVQKRNDTDTSFGGILADIMQNHRASAREWIVEILSDSPRAAVNFISPASGDSFVAFSITALIRGDKQTVLTLRVSDKEWPDTKERWESIISYMGSLGYLEADKAKPLSEPEAWIDELTAAGLEHGTDLWWEEIEKRVREYWAQKGRAALPIKGRLERVTGCTRKTIYEKTLLGDKDVTQSDIE